MLRLEVSVDWTATDALIVVGFLDKLATAIWQTYGREMSEAVQAMADYDDESVIFDGEPPF